MNLPNWCDHEIIIDLTVFSIFELLLLYVFNSFLQLGVIVELSENSEACLLDFLLEYFVFDVVTILNEMVIVLLFEFVDSLLLERERELRHFY